MTSSGAGERAGDLGACATASLDVDHPWPGPDSFRAQDAAFFRGRETEIKQLLQLIRRTQSVVLYGASGLGKTSLINAGVVPRLAADEYFAVPIRICYVPGSPPVSDQIQGEIAKRRSGPGMPKPRPGETVWELLHLRNEPIEGAQPLLIFDQFEELFTIGAGTPQADQLIEELRALIEGVPPRRVRERLEQSPEDARTFAFQRRDHRILLSIREDLLYGLESLRTQLPSIIHNRYRIGPLGGGMALEVVLQRPAAGPGTGGDTQPAAAPLVEPDVAELIVRTVASAAPADRPLDTLEVEPALLSILCTELARRRSPGTPITRELVTGNRIDIISSFYERALQGASDAVRAYIEDELVTSTGFRTSAVVAEALAVPGFTDQVLADFVTKRLLRVIDRPNGKWVELTHDILTQIAARNRALREGRRREQEARDQERRARERRDLRRVRITSAVLLLLLVVSVGGCVLAFSSWKVATRAALEAEHQTQVAEQQTQIAEKARQEEQRQRGLAERAMRDAVEQKALTQKTLAAFERNQQIRQAALSPTDSHYGENLKKLLSDLSQETNIKFRAEAADQHYKDSQGREIYYFVLYPQRDTLPEGVAFITYLEDHPTFHTTLMTAGPDRHFRVNYTGWGCLTRIVAVIEFTTPSKPPAVKEFNMCAALGDGWVRH